MFLGRLRKLYITFHYNYIGKKLDPIETIQKLLNLQLLLLLVSFIVVQDSVLKYISIITYDRC